MASALYSGLRDRGLIPGHDCCVVYLGKTVYSYSASRHLGVQVGIGKLWGEPEEIVGKRRRGR